MIRPILVEVALFSIPFAGYALYLLATRAGVFDAQAWSLPVVLWLALAAVVLTLGSLIILAQFGGEPPYSTYKPAHMENGRLVPGEVR